MTGNIPTHYISAELAGELGVEVPEGSGRAMIPVVGHPGGSCFEIKEPAGQWDRRTPCQLEPAAQPAAAPRRGLQAMPKAVEVLTTCPCVSTVL